MTKGYFITGTDTNIGKTLVAAAVTLKLGGVYWKPVQTGSPPDDDTEAVRRLTTLPDAHFLCPLYCYQPPLSPHLAARLSRRPIEVERFTLPAVAHPLVIEGAGGVFVPLTSSFFMRDLMQRFGLPVIVVASTRLGTINHTLLTLAALRAVDLPIAGVVMNGAPNSDTLDAIASFGKAPMLGWLPTYPELSPATARDAAQRLYL